MAQAKEKDEKKERKNIEKIKNPEKFAKIKKKRIIIVSLTTIILIVIALFFSVIFSFVHNSKTTIAKGVSVKSINLSSLTTQDAKDKLKQNADKQLSIPIKLKYGDDFSLDINASEIEFTFDIDAMVTEAYDMGRKGNIFQSNLEIIDTYWNGKEIDVKYNYNEDALKKIVNNINTSLPGKVVEYAYDIEENELIITPGKDGLIAKEDQVKNLILSTFANRIDGKVSGDVQAIDLPVENKVADVIDLDKIYKEIYCEPQDAYLEEDPFKLVKDISGVDFAISMDEAKALITGDKEEYIIPLKITPANQTVADLGSKLFPQTLATYSTNYDAGYAARSTNLRLAANKINGTILLPGEEFSFNKVVGKRTVQDGYQNAPIYENGKVVDGLAGGICQISSTLYNAVLLANLEIVERRNHNFTSTYVPAGRDATVVYGSIDFKFKNTRNFPIKINASVSGGVATFELKGIKEEVEYDVKIVTQTIATYPFTEELVEDATLAAGTKQVTQAGHNGSKVSSYRVLYQNGQEVSRKLLYTDTYKVMNRVIKVSPSTAEAPNATVTETIQQEIIDATKTEEQKRQEEEAKKKAEADAAAKKKAEEEAAKKAEEDRKKKEEEEKKKQEEQNQQNTTPTEPSQPEETSPTEN